MKKEQNTKPSSVKIDVRIDRLTKGDKKVKAYASASFADAFAIHGIRIIDTPEKGLFVGMPQASFKKGGETKYVDTFHAITAEARDSLHTAVLTAYWKAVMDAKKGDNSNG